MAIQGLAGDGGLDPKQRVQRSDGPIGSKSEDGACIKQRSKGVCGFATLFAEASFTPPTIIRSVVRLHGRNDLLACEPREMFDSQMLRVFDAKTAIPLWIG